MKSFSVLAAASFLFVLPALGGCSSGKTGSGGEPGSDPAMVKSALVRNDAPTVPSADADALRDGNRAFAADLYKTLAADPSFEGKNLFFSPYSISAALAMTYAGARNATATQMASALHYTLSEDALHPAFNALDLALASRGVGAKGDTGGAFQLRVVNSMWGAPQTKFEAPFLDTLAVNYGAGVRLTDFAANPENARTEINGWVDTQTQDRIKDLIPVGALDASTRFVLVNAVYFNAAWAVPFDASQTQKQAFHGLAGDTQVDFMRQSGELAYGEGAGWKAVSLPYDGGQLSMVAVLPTTVGTFETGFTGDQAASIIASLGSAEVNLQLPKFTIDGASFSLKTALTARGMVDAFSDKADFSGISTTESLLIGDVLHEAFVSVDEKGTEAAAATAIIGEATSAPARVIDLTLDHPFVFFIRDNQTGAILFLGRVVGL